MVSGSCVARPLNRHSPSYRDVQIGPATGLTPARLHLGDAKQAMPVFAAPLSAIPLQKIARRPADASRRGKRAQALLAALLLITDRPAQTEKREQDKGEELQQIGRKWNVGMERQAQINAQQESEKQNLQRFQRKEGLSFDPEAPSGEVDLA